MPEVLEQLVTMSHYLGDTGRPYAILGEGNTSARIDSDHFYVKASGATLGAMGASDFLAVRVTKLVQILEDPSAGDEDVSRVLRESLVDGAEKRKPSVETMLHAVLYQYPEIHFVGHTHPEAVGGLLCSAQAQAFAEGRVCPDQIVVTGHKSVFVPYVDPGLQLAREVRTRMREFVDREGVLPKTILLENHGFFAMADTAKKVMNITDMAEKSARIVLNAYAAGGPKFLGAADVQRIDTRPDELYRRKFV